MIQYIEQRLSGLNLMFVLNFLPANNLQFPQQKQQPLNKEEVLPSLIANVVVANLSVNAFQDFVDRVMGDEAFLDDQG